jgi:hypothetical protein
MMACFLNGMEPAWLSDWFRNGNRIFSGKTENASLFALTIIQLPAAVSPRNTPGKLS